MANTPAINLTVDTSQVEADLERLSKAADRIIAKLDQINQKAADAKRGTADLSDVTGSTEAAGAD